MAAIFNLSHPAHVITWHFITLSVANVVVLVVMLVVFALAILIPFPHGEEEEGQHEQRHPSTSPSTLMDGRPA